MSKKESSISRIFTLSKRQRFIIGVGFLSLCLFFSENLFGRYGVFLSFFLSILTDVFLFLAIRKDLKEKFSGYVFILPFFFSLAFGLFYFLVPSRFLTKIIMTSLYAVGMYSLFLSQNIFTVASTRTIALLSGARIVSFVETVVSFLFLSNIIFSLHIAAIPTAIMIFVCSFFLILQSLWTITLENSGELQAKWALLLSICLFEIALILWFWPSSPTAIALFLTGFFYTIVGPSQVWFDKRLFRGVMWEYIWVAAGVMSILIWLTSWRG